MKKIKFDFLKKKYGPLPGWAWALVIAGVIYVLYRHFQNSGGGSSSSSAAPSGTDTAPTAPGDLTGAGPGNAGDTGTVDSGTVDTGGLGGDFSGSGGLGGALDSGQGSTTDTGNSTDTSSATPGLTHITGDYWWDSSNSKLIKIPGSGGQAKGSGKKKAPKAKGKKAGKGILKPKTKAKGSSLVRTRIRARKHPASQRTMRSPHPVIKKKVIPKRRKPLNVVQRRAIAHAHHPDVVPLKKPPVRRAPRQLPRRQVIRRRPR